MIEFKKLGTQFDRVRTDLNENFEITERELRNHQSQIDKLVVEGDSSPQAAAASVGADGTIYGSLKSRLDAENNAITSQLAQTIRRGTARLDDFDEETRRMIQGLEPGEINAVLGDSNVKFNNIATEQVDYDHVAFLNARGNLFRGDYYRYSIADEGWLADNSNATSVILRVSPNTEYKIRKENSNRSRIAFNHNFPKVGEPLKRILPSDIGEGTQEYTVRTNHDEFYLIHYLSATAEEPVYIIEKGDKITYNPFEVEITDKIVFEEDIVAGNITKGKNMFDMEFVDGTIAGTFEGAEITDSDRGKLAILPVKPYTSYAISKTESNRFRIGFTVNYPTPGRPVTLIKDGDNDSNRSTVVKSGDRHHFLVIYVSFDGAPPDFMQVEENDKVTSWETYGYHFKQAKSPAAQEADGFLPNTPEYYGAVGNANYIHTDGTVWEDESMTVPATDDTEALRKFFNSSVKNLEFPLGKKYLVTDTIKNRPSLNRNILGNGSTLIGQGDFLILDCEGRLTGSANPQSSGAIVESEHGQVISHLKIMSSSKDSCTGIRISKNFGLTLHSCALTFLKDGIKVEDRNRNLIMYGNHVYACTNNGLHFTDGGDLHQLNMFGNHISYCKINVFFDNHNIFNIQITGNDIETSSYPEVALHNLYFVSRGCMIEDIEIVGNTIEDHLNTDEMIKFEALDPSRILAITVTGNVIGNSDGNEISIKNATGVSISGNSFKNSKKHSYKLEGIIDGLNISDNTHSPDGGGLLHCTATLTNVVIAGNTLSKRCGQNPIVIDNELMEAVSITNNTVMVTETSRFDGDKACIDVKSQNIKGVHMSQNTINSKVPTQLAMAVDSPSLAALIAKDNIAIGYTDNPFGTHVDDSSNVFA
ncbi:hypothetical protein J26TS2_00920 [Shouchella clausii]|nr:hypothetical protein J26TS2_00920 [Shouchella clausii]